MMALVAILASEEETRGTMRHASASLELGIFAARKALRVQASKTFNAFIRALLTPSCITVISEKKF